MDVARKVAHVIAWIWIIFFGLGGVGKAIFISDGGLPETIGRLIFVFVLIMPAILVVTFWKAPRHQDEGLPVDKEVK